MSNSSSEKPRDFWHALARFGATGAPFLAWDEAAGPSFSLLRPFLKSLPRPAPAYAPCPRCPRARRLSEMPDDTFILEIPDTCGICESVRNIPRHSVQPMALDVAAFVGPLAGALGIAPPLRLDAQGAVLLPLGTFDRGPQIVPVYLLLADDPAAQRHVPAFVRVTPPAIVLLCIVDPAGIETLRARGLWSFHAAALLEPAANLRFRATRSLSASVTQFLAGAEIRPPRPALTLKGRRYEIADDFSWVKRLGKKPHVEQVTNLTTRAALRVLVEAGAGSERDGLQKALFCRRVHESRSPNKPMPGDPKPAHYFRRSVARRIKPYAFYGDLVSVNESGGLYWLEL